MVDTEALWPIRKRENSLREKHDQERHEYENSRLAWDKARDAAIKNAKPKGSRAAIKAALDTLGPAPDALLEPLLTCPEPTYEGLCRLFSVGQPSLGIFASEGGQFIGGHGMSDDAKLRTAAGLSAAWDGEPFKRVQADGAIVLPGRRLAMHIMAQPDVASTMLNDRMLADQGTLSRILVTSPDATSGTRLWREPSTDVRRGNEAIWCSILDILKLPLPLAAGSQSPSPATPAAFGGGAPAVDRLLHSHRANSRSRWRTLASSRPGQQITGARGAARGGTGSRCRCRGKRDRR